MSFYRHLVSATSLLFGLANLTFWCLPLLVLTLVRLFLPPATGLIRSATDAVYRTAVGCNDWWFRRVLGYEWRPFVPHLDQDRSCVVVANHQSWADSFLIQTAIVHQGPVLKVLVKQQLMWIPVLALIFWAYDFPRLQRRARHEGDEPARRREDARRVRDACRALDRSPGAMLVYPEGTRFTEKKRLKASPYQHLLALRTGGFGVLMNCLEELTDLYVVDLTIHYPDGPGFWAFLSGGVREPVLTCHTEPVLNIQDPATWLTTRWAEKDRVLAAASSHQQRRTEANADDDRR